MSVELAFTCKGFSTDFADYFARFYYVQCFFMQRWCSWQFGRILTLAYLSSSYHGCLWRETLLRLGFELFIGSSIFLAFFTLMDPATTALTYTGQIIFGVGVGILIVVIQTYMNFL